MTTPTTHSNLSDTRGNRLGIGFFKVCMFLFGLRFCCLFVWFVAFFYALFDRKAFQAAKPYLQSRFPNCSTLKLRWHFYRMIVSQGQAIVMAYWLRTGHHLPLRDVNPQHREAMLKQAEHGFIMLMSHVGCWQATIPRMEGFHTRINLLIQENMNEAMSKLMEGKLFRIISNQSPFGGLLDAAEALENHEVLCLMGDRLPDDVPTNLTLSLCGRTLRIPEAPWHLAARSHLPIFIVFTIMRSAAIDYIYMPPFTIDYDLPRKPNPTVFAPYIAKYQEALQTIASDYPYQVFHYEITTN